MTIDERSRHQLFQRLEAVLGAHEAATLMEHLPPVGWADVATKRDVDALAVATKRDLDALGAELRTEIALCRTELRGEIAELRGDLRGEIAELRGDLRGDIGDLRAEMHHEIGRVYDQLATHTRTLTIAMVSSVLTAVALSFAAVHR